MLPEVLENKLRQSKWVIFKSNSAVKEQLVFHFDHLCSFIWLMFIYSGSWNLNAGKF